MSRWTWGLSVAVIVSHLLGTVHAAPPLDLTKVGTPAALTAEAQDLLGEIEKGLESSDGYKMSEAGVKQAASLLAVVGQALAEHPEDSELKKAGPSIRQAAIKVARAKTYEEAQAGLKDLKPSVQGTVSPDVPVEFDWAKLSRMHPLMEQMNGRAAKFRRAARRPKDPEVDSRHVMAIALAAVATHADTHEVKKQEDLPAWHGFANELFTHMTEATAAVKAKDMEAAQKSFSAGMQTCQKCHDQFQD